jgi:signal transduction histidine kinase
MALTITFMAFFSIILAIRNLKSKYNLLFILMVFGMSISLFTIVSEIYKSSNYIVPSYYLYSGIEYKMFLFLSRILRLSLSNLQLLRNLGIVSYLVAILMFAITFSKNVKGKQQGAKQVGHVLRYTALAAYPILYFFFYHPDMAFYLYLTENRLTGSKRELWIQLFTVLDKVMVIITLLYMMYPIILLFRNYRKNKISFFSEQLLGLAISISLLNTIFFFVFFTGVFKTSIENVFTSAFWRYKPAVVVPKNYVTLLPMISLIILLVILYITFKFKTDSMINSFKERAIKKNLNLLNTNLKDVLHSDKNIMFNIKILAESAISNYGTEEGREVLQKIATISESHMEAISKTLDNIKELRVRTIKSNLIEAVEWALKENPVPEHIQLNIAYHDNPVYCNFDMYHMTQVIGNLISNAIDAINSKNSEEAWINITVDSSKEWIYLSIHDSGCGIKKKNLKKIFTPYFSTKSKQNNWGMGLSYVFRVITAHCGHLRVKSRYGEYTNVEILLPMSKK